MCPSLGTSTAMRQYGRFWIGPYTIMTAKAGWETKTQEGSWKIRTWLQYRGRPCASLLRITAWLISTQRTCSIRPTRCLGVTSCRDLNRDQLWIRETPSFSHSMTMRQFREEEVCSRLRKRLKTFKRKLKKRKSSRNSLKSSEGALVLQLRT